MAPTPGTTPAGRSVSAACARVGPGSLSGSNRGQRIKWDHVGSAVSPAFRCQPHTQPRHRHLPRPSPCPGSTLRMNLPWGWPADQGHGPRCLQKDLCRWGRPGEILEGCPPPCTPPRPPPPPLQGSLSPREMKLRPTSQRPGCLLLAPGSHCQLSVH